MTRPAGIDVLLVCYPVMDVRVALAGPLPIEAGTTTLADAVTMAPGGLATTVFMAGRLGLNAVQLGVVGQDELGDLLVRGYQREGASTEGLQQEPGFATQAVVVLAEAQQHAYASVLRGRTAESAKAHELLARSRSLVVSGYMFADPEHARPTLELAGTARAQGIPVVLDPGPLYPAPEVRQRALAATDVLVLNDREARQWSGERDVEAATSVLGSLMTPGALVVVKAGARGAFVGGSSNNGRWHAGFAVPVVDEVGAGDAFLAGLLRGRLSGWSEEDTLALANASGAATAAKPGAGPQTAEAGDVEALLRAHGREAVARAL